MSNYPPGMTKEHWRHIDGEPPHVEACPMSDGNLTCCKKHTWSVEYRDTSWYLLHRYGAVSHEVEVTFCPFCGTELLTPECRCEEIVKEGKDHD